MNIAFIHSCLILLLCYMIQKNNLELIILYSLWRSLNVYCAFNHCSYVFNHSHPQNYRDSTPPPYLRVLINLWLCISTLIWFINLCPSRSEPIHLWQVKNNSLVQYLFFTVFRARVNYCFEEGNLNCGENYRLGSGVMSLHYYETIEWQASCPVSNNVPLLKKIFPSSAGHRIYSLRSRKVRGRCCAGFWSYVFPPHKSYNWVTC